MGKPRIGHLAALSRACLIFGVLCGCGCRPDVPPRVSTLTPPPEYEPVSNSPNAFDAYALAAKEVEQEDPHQLTQVSFFPGQKDTAIKRCAVQVKEVERATEMACRFNFVPRPPFHAPPYQAGWRLLGHVMRWQIDDACAKANWDSAIETTVCATKFGFDLTGGGPTDASLGLAIVDDARTAIAPFLAKMGAGQLQRLADGIEDDLTRKPPITEAVGHNAENIKLAVAKLEQSAASGTFVELTQNLGPEVKEAVDYLEGIRSNSAKLSDYFSQFEEEADAHTRYLMEVSPMPAALRGDPPKPTAKERPWKHFGRHFFLAADPLLALNDQTLARTRLLILNAELIKAFKLKAAYPTSLAAFDPAIKTDPYTGADFRYRSDGTDCSVYSVGANLRDDGGETDESFTTPDLKLEMKE